MTTRKKYPGLSFEKFDLHVHTPASHDFPDKKVTPESVVERALDAGLRGIAITDHNTGEFIDKVKAAAKGKPLIVFPGVEICCTGGKSGIHIVAILGKDKGKKHVDGLLAAIGIAPDDFGKRDAATTKAPYEVIDTVASPTYGGIAVLAHCTSSKGVLHDITGVTRTKLFEHSGLLAVEVPEQDFTDPDKTREHKRAVDLLDGKDPNYACRRMGVYIASDSRKEGDNQHCLGGIGSKWTYLKVDAEPTLESLRQCFIDRDVRIRQLFEYKPSVLPTILEVKVKGGFFDGEEAEFHRGLNSILGAKGAGKSLLVELIRFALGQPPTTDEIRDDHQRKLERRLETYGSVIVRLVDETGAEHELERTYNPSKNSPYREPHHESLASSFESLFLSQNEIVKIAENEKLQIGFIDRFFDFRHYKDRIAMLESDLEALDTQFAEALRAMQLHGEAMKQILAVKVRMGKLDKLLADPIYNVYKKAEEKDNLLKAQCGYIEGIRARLSVGLEAVGKVGFPKVESSLADDPAIQRNVDILAKVHALVDDELRGVIEKLKDAYKDAEREYKKWAVTFAVEKAKYQEHMRNVGGDKKELEAQRLRLVKEMEDLTKREQGLLQKKNALKGIKSDRDCKIDELFEVYSQYSAERKSKCEKFERESQGRLRVGLEESTNLEEFKARLNSLKRGSYLKGTEVDNLCERVSPREFILDLLRYQLDKDQKRIEALAKKVGVEKERIRSLCEFLLAEIPYEELLSLQYRAHPEDRPEISYQVSKDRYEALRDISIGQKCTAMLIMALSEGRFPIIIDQPEDSLDVRSVWDDMCQKVRGSKENRQFIFTTHNSCLAVASDTDKYIVVENIENKGKVTMSGAIESGPLKEEVIKYLEGGRRTYRAKSQKYGDLESVKNDGTD